MLDPFATSNLVRMVSESVGSCLQSARRRLATAYQRWEISRARAGHIAGFTILCELELAEAAPSLMEKVVGALALIQEVDVRRFERLQREMPQLLVKRGAGSQYWSETKTCVLEVERVRHRSAALLALTIIHESGHARIDRAGIPWRREFFQRIERRCIKEQISFAQAMETAGWQMSDTISLLMSAMDKPYLSEEFLQDWRARAAQAYDLPRCFVRMLLVFTGRRSD